MLKSKSVANLIEETLNKNDKDEQFRVVYEVGGYKGRAINCILKQGKGSVMPISNYTNTKTPFRLEVVTPVQCGEDRIDDIVDIVNNCLLELNGKIEDIDNGKAVFLFNSLEIGEYETRATAGQSVLIKIEFFVEYAMNVGTKYELALITNEFDYGSVNTRRFDTRQQQIDWFDKRIKKGADYCEVLMPNIDSLVLTQQRYLNTHNLDVNDVLQMNYAIIRETKESGETKYYYYYVTNSNIGEYNLITLDLSMDTLQTHYIDLEFGDCFISKADINRWIDNGDGTVSFDTTVNSELFEREDVKDVSKRLVSRDVLGVNGTPYDEVNEWLSENVLGWLYFYVDSKTYHTVGNAKIKFASLRHSNLESSSDVQNQYLNEASIYNSLCCLAVPVMKNRNDLIFVSGETKLQISQQGLKDFIADNTALKIYACKFSLVMPIHYIGGWEIKEEGEGSSKRKNLYLTAKAEERSVTLTEGDKTNTYNYTAYILNGSYASWDVEAFTTTTAFGTGYGFLNVINQLNINTTVGYTLDQQYTFTKEEIRTSKHDMKFNPKLLSSDYKGLVLSDNLQNGAEYDILKLGKNDLRIAYTEALTPDISKRYIRISNLDGFYIPELANNLTGYVVSDDTSITLETSAFEGMLANNKNFFLQNSVNRESQMYQARLQTAFNVGTSAINNGANLLGSGGMNMLNTGISSAQNMIVANHNYEIDKKNELMAVDNLKNAPSSINGAKGNVIFNAMYSKVGIVVEIYDILPNEKKIVDDGVKMYGMTLNKVDNIKKYDNIRAYHNYIQANIENIKGNISSPIRDDIRQRFANGIRFWNVDEISYENENYERWLEA